MDSLIGTEKQLDAPPALTANWNHIGSSEPKAGPSESATATDLPKVNINSGSEHRVESLPQLANSADTQTRTLPMYVMTNRANGEEKSGYLGGGINILPVHYYSVPVQITVSANYPNDASAPSDTKVDWSKKHDFANIDDFITELKQAEDGSQKTSTNLYVHGVFTSGEEAIKNGAGVSAAADSLGVVVDWAAVPISSMQKHQAEDKSKAPPPQDQIELGRQLFLNDVRNAVESVKQMNEPLDKISKALGDQNTSIVGFSEGGRFVLNYLDLRAQSHEEKLGNAVLAHPEVESTFLDEHPAACEQFSKMYVLGNMADQALNTLQRFSVHGLESLSTTENYPMGNLPFNETKKGMPWENACKNLLAIDDSSENLQAFKRGQPTLHYIDMAVTGSLLKYSKVPDVYQLHPVEGRNRALLQYPTAK